MASAAYQASVGILSYHLPGVDYDIAFDLMDIRPPSGNALVSRQESLSGVVETNYYGERRIWNATIAPIQRSSAAAAQILEFLRSTADGQTFQFDPYGRTGAPVAPMTVIREDDGYTEEKFQEIDGVSDYIKLSFSVREA